MNLPFLLGSIFTLLFGIVLGFGGFTTEAVILYSLSCFLAALAIFLVGLTRFSRGARAFWAVFFVLGVGFLSLGAPLFGEPGTTVENGRLTEVFLPFSSTHVLDFLIWLSDLFNAEFGTRVEDWFDRIDESQRHRANMLLSAFVYLAVYIIGLFGVTSVLEVVRRGLKLYGNRGTGIAEFEDRVQMRLGTLGVHWSCGMIWAGILGVMMALPRISDQITSWLGDLENLGEIGAYYQGILWMGPALLFGELFAAGRPTEKQTAQSPAKRRKRRISQIADRTEALYKNLLSVFSLMGIEEGTQKIEEPIFEKQRSDWVASVMAGRAAQGLKTGAPLEAALREIDRALARKDGLRGVILQDDLSAQKLDILASILREFRSRGLSLLVISSAPRLTAIVEFFREAEARINSALASFWRPFSGTDDWPTYDVVVYSTLEELSTEDFRIDHSPHFAAFLARLGGVFILDAHTLDFTLLGQKINLIDDIVLNPSRRKADYFICVQGARMMDFEEGIRRVLPGASTYLGLEGLPHGQAPGDQSRTFKAIFDPLTVPEASVRAQLKEANNSEDLPKTAAVLKFLDTEKAQSALLDPMNIEILQGWQRLCRDLATSQIDRTRVIDDLPKPVPLEGEIAPEVVMVRDTGNLASFYTGHPRGHAPNPGIVLAFADPGPYNRMLKAEIERIQANPEKVLNRSLDRYLPRIPASPVGFQDTFRYLAARFLAAPNNTLAEEEIRRVIEEGLADLLAAGLRDTTEDAAPQLFFNVDVDGLSRWFTKVFGQSPDFVKQPSQYHRREIRCRDETFLRHLVTGGHYRISATDDNELVLPVGDEGLTFADGSVVNAFNTRYTFQRSGEGYKLDTSQAINQNLDVSPREIFARRYRIEDVDLCGDLRNYKASPLLRFFAQVERVSTRRFERRGSAWRQVEELTSGKAHKWFAPGLLLRFPVREGDEIEPPAAAMALGLTLSTFLEQKFTSVSHRLPVLLPQVDVLGTPDADSGFSPEIGRLELGDLAREILFEKEIQGAKASVDLILLEEADHALGVLQAIQNNVNSDEVDIMPVWRDLLAHCQTEVENGMTPYQMAELGDLRPDFKGALNLLERTA